MQLEACASFEDFRGLAKRKLPSILFDYIDGGSYSEQTLQENTSDFKKVYLNQRILKDMGSIDSSINLFGCDLPIPLILGPVGFAGMYARRGEVQAARAAKNQQIPFVLSTVGICSVDEVTKACQQAPWFQLYMIKDRDWIKDLLGEVKLQGCQVLFLTCDLQTPGARYRDLRSGMMRKLSLIESFKRGFEGIAKAGWTYDVFMNGRPHSFGNLHSVLPQAASFNEAWQWISKNFDPTVTWKDLDFIRSHWDGPLIIKGVMTTADAIMAMDNGVDGIVVSNHGGRQLDGSPSAISVLPDIADAIASKTKILFDSGVRSGLDILKAINLGADACLIGRSWAFGLAAGGQAGVERVLDIYTAELKTAQVLAGISSLRGMNS
jgi:L-lactate dehydrogenase (cytochrome)